MTLKIKIDPKIYNGISDLTAFANQLATEFTTVTNFTVKSAKIFLGLDDTILIALKTRQSDHDIMYGSDTVDIDNDHAITINGQYLDQRFAEFFKNHDYQLLIAGTVSMDNDDETAFTIAFQYRDYIRQ